VYVINPYFHCKNLHFVKLCGFLDAVSQKLPDKVSVEDFFPELGAPLQMEGIDAEGMFIRFKVCTHHVLGSNSGDSLKAARGRRAPLPDLIFIKGRKMFALHPPPEGGLPSVVFART